MFEINSEGTFDCLLLCCKDDQKRAGHLKMQSAWKQSKTTRDLYIRLLIEVRHLAQNGEELMQGDIQAGFDGVCIGNTKKAVLSSSLLDIFKEDETNIFSLLLQITHAQRPETLPSRVQMAAVSSGFEMCELVPTIAYDNAAFKVTEDVRSVAVSVLQIILYITTSGLHGKPILVFWLYPSGNGLRFNYK